MENSDKSSNKSCIVFGIIIGAGILVLALAAGYYFLVLIPSNAQPDDLTVSGGPDIMFISPTSGALAEVGDSLLVHVTTNDVAGVARIDLWIDGTLALSQPSPQEAGVSPLSLYHSLNALLPGDYSLVARAYNTRGAMSESIAINVKVVEAQDDDVDDGSLQYKVQEGDTLEKIAELTGNSVAGIKAANPGLNNVQKNQKIVIKHPPLKKESINPNMGAIAGFQPQALPPGMQGLAAGQQLPNINPDFGELMNKNPSSVKVPDGLATKVDGCKVTITWNDHSDNETGFGIYRRRSPDQVASQLVKVVGSNKESYVDEVPYPASYEYAVEAFGKLNKLAPGQIAAAGVQQVMDTGRSQPKQVKVEPSADCIKNPNSFKIVYMKIVDVNPKNSEIDRIAAWFSINDGTPHRVPFAFEANKYAVVGQWSSNAQIEIPLPTSVLLNPDQPIIVKIWASGYSEKSWMERNEGPSPLGVSFDSHQVNNILSVPISFEANGTEFKAKYQIWVEDVKWDAVLGGSTCPSSETPSNLAVDSSALNTRRLVWDFTGKGLDNFILFRSYSCVGQESKIEAPVFISSEKRSYDLDYRYEPHGCVYSYKMAANSACGQSKRSNAVVGNTEAGLSVLWLTFKELRVYKMPDDNQLGTQVVLRAGYQTRKSDPMWLTTGVHELDSIFLNGKMPNNYAYMALAEKQSPDIFFSVSSVDMKGNASMGSICLGSFTLPPIETWQGTERTDTLLSTDGNCELTIDWKLQPPSPGVSGSTALPQADLVIDDLATIGSRIYARISNNGPDQLPGNQIYLKPGYGIKCDNGERADVSPWFLMDYWMGFNTPVWVDLGRDFELDVFYRSNISNVNPKEWIPPSGKNKWTNCSAGYFVYVGDREYPNGELYYQETNLANNLFYTDYINLKPMK